MPNKPAEKPALGASLASPTPAQRYFKNQWQDASDPLGGGYQFGGAPTAQAPQAPKVAPKGPLGGGMNTLQGAGGGGGYTTQNNALTVPGGGKADSGGGGGGGFTPPSGPSDMSTGFGQVVQKGQAPTGSMDVNHDKAKTDALAKLLGIEKDASAGGSPFSPYPTQPAYSKAANPAQSYLDEIARLGGQVGETYNTGWIDNALKMQLADMANQQAGGEMRINEQFGASGLGGSGFQAADLAGSQLDYAMGRSQAINQSEQAKQEAIRQGLAAQLSATQGAAGLDIQGQQLGADVFQQKLDTVQSIRGNGLANLADNKAWQEQYAKDYDAYSLSLVGNPNLDATQIAQMLSQYTDAWIQDKGIGPYKTV